MISHFHTYEDCWLKSLNCDADADVSSIKVQDHFIHNMLNAKNTTLSKSEHKCTWSQMSVSESSSHHLLNQENKSERQFAHKTMGFYSLVYSLHTDMGILLHVAHIHSIFYPVSPGSTLCCS
jgi:hypothetical protein